MSGTQTKGNKMDIAIEIIISAIQARYMKTIVEMAWEKALAFAPVNFDLADEWYKDEYYSVVVAQGVETVDGYKKANRGGREACLSRKMRVEIWTVFEEYKSQLKKLREKYNR